MARKRIYAVDTGGCAVSMSSLAQRREVIVLELNARFLEIFVAENPAHA